jgi:acyl-CoA synthetase (AMP-forming)/AMP-acid ligase II
MRTFARSRAKEEAMTIRSPHPDVAIPDVSLTTLVLGAAAARGDAPALVAGEDGRTITYAQLDDLVRRCAAGFVARGLRAGDVVGIYAPNLPEYAVAFLGVARAGGVNTTANALYTAGELAFQLHDAGARFLVTVPPLLERALEAAAAAEVEEVFVIGGDGAAGGTPFTALLGGDGAELPPEPAPDALISLPYSSGTTGFPKGVMLSHRNLVANVAQCRPLRDIGPADRVIAFLPFFHIYGQTVLMCWGLHRGATLVTMTRFDLAEFLRLVEEQRATAAFVVPPVVVALAKHPAVEGRDLSSLSFVMCGAAPLDGDVGTAAGERIGCAVIQGYGLTETSPVVCKVPDGVENRPGSIGPLVPNTEARLVDVATGEDALPGEPGELWVRGPQVMEGYLNNPSATAATLDADGFLHTGDIATVDDDGWFTIADRLKELIKYKGYQVPPAELEAVLLGHPAVSEACVIPLPDEEAGEIPKAFVVLRAHATPEELMAWVADRVAPHKRVRALEVIDEIPKSPSGKLLRRVLRDRERAAQPG